MPQQAGQEEVPLGRITGSSLLAEGAVSTKETGACSTPTAVDWNEELAATSSHEVYRRVDDDTACEPR